MEFKNYFFAMSGEDRKLFAQTVGSSVGHLNNCAYGYVPFGPALCLAIERKTRKQITRGQLRPNDGHLIWPDVKQSVTFQSKRQSGHLIWPKFKQVKPNITKQGE